MTSRKDKDIVAGRLGAAKPSPTQKAHYGKSRLGLAPETDETPEAPIVEQPNSLGFHAPHRLPDKSPADEARAELQALADRLPPSTSRSAAPVDHHHDVYPLHDPHVGRGVWPRLRTRRIQAAVAAVGLLAAVAIWAVFSGPKPAPRTAAADVGLQKPVAASPEPVTPATSSVRRPQPTTPPITLAPRDPTPRPPRKPAASPAEQPPAPNHSSRSVMELANSILRRGQRPVPTRAPQATPTPTYSPQPAPATPRYIERPPGFRVSGIMRMPAGRFANINGRYVAAGEYVNGARVVEIREFVVEMERSGERFLLGVSGPAPAPTAPTEGETDEETGEGQPASDDDPPPAG